MAPSLGSAQIAVASRDRCCAQLARILDSLDFDATEREHRFLRFIVEETLAGRAERIKAYSIAQEVFGRDSSFDPQNDPLVRIVAGHVRRALERYYLTAGLADPVIITISKGSYVPNFVVRADEPGGPPIARNAATPLAELQATLGRQPFQGTLARDGARGDNRRCGSDPDLGPQEWLRGHSEEPRHTAFARRALSRPFRHSGHCRDRRGIERGSHRRDREIQRPRRRSRPTGRRGGRPRDHVASPSTAPRYSLEGSVNLLANSLRVRVRLSNRTDGSVLWANSYDGDLKVGDLLNIEEDISRQIATALAQPYGVIFQADSSLHVENPPDDWEAYACTLSYYAYRANLDAKTHPLVRSCLESAVARFPDYATAWALLSQIYVDEVRFHYPAASGRAPASIDRALQAARHAVALDPQNVRGLEAEMFALYFAGDKPAALKVGEEAIKINPNDTELTGEYGYRLALSGEWTRGCQLVATARELNPGPIAYYELALALCAYYRGDYQGAAMWIRKTTVPENAVYHMVAAGSSPNAALPTTLPVNAIGSSTTRPDL